DLFRGEDRDGPLVRGPFLDAARLALADAPDEALLHVHAPGDDVADLVAHLLQAQRLAQAERHVLAEGRHFLAHRDDRHGITLSRSMARRGRATLRAPWKSAARRGAGRRGW